MNYTWIVWMGYSIFLPAGIGLIRLRQIDPVFHPFLLCTWMAALNEVVSVTLQHHGMHTGINNNLYVLAEALLLVAVLQRMGAVMSPLVYRSVQVLIAIAWSLETVAAGELHLIHSGFRLFYAALLVILSIHLACRLVLAEKEPLARNAAYWLVTGFILYFTYKILVEIFWLYGLNASPEFLEKVYLIHAWVNMVCNIIYALAILWMPAKRTYSMPY